MFRTNKLFALTSGVAASIAYAPASQVIGCIAMTITVIAGLAAICSTIECKR